MAKTTPQAQAPDAAKELLSQIQIDLNGFNTLDMLRQFYKTDQKLIGIGAQLATISDKLNDVEKNLGIQNTAIQHLQNDANQVSAKKPNQGITDAMQSVRNELNSFTESEKKLETVTNALKDKMNSFTSAVTIGSLDPSEVAAKRKEMRDEIAVAKKDLEALQSKQKQLATQILSKESPLYRMIVAAAADLSLPTAIQQHLQQLTTRMKQG